MSQTGPQVTHPPTAMETLDYAELLHSLDGGVLLLDGECRILFCNRWFSRHCGLTEQEIIGRAIESLFPTPLPPALLDAIDSGCRLRMSRILSHQLHKQLLPLWQPAPGGERLPLYQSILIKPLHRSNLTLLQCLDITNAVRRERHLRASERILRLESRVQERIATSDSLDEILLMLCNTVETTVPGAYAAILLADGSGQQLQIKTAPSLPGNFLQHPEGLHLTPEGTTCAQAFLSRGLVVCPDIQQESHWGTWRERAQRQGILACWAQPIMATHNEVVGVFACFLQHPMGPDDTQRLLLQRMAHLAAIAMERHERLERIRFLAMHDPLTGLPNRSLLNELLSHNLRRAQREGIEFALMFIDLDGFKQINDLHGHDAGDDLLSVLAGRLLAELRAADTCARIGGDEFVVLLESVASAHASEQVAEKLLRCLGRPVERGPLQLHVTASIGIAVYPQDGSSADALLTRADDAMYRAKALGKNRWYRLTR